MTPPLAVDVVGAGGIGCALGYALLRAGATVRFVEADPVKLAAGRRDGVTVEGHRPLDAEFVSFAEWRPRIDGVIFLCTKSYDNAAVLGVVPASAWLLPVQNGFDPALENHGHAAEGIASFVSECRPDAPVTRITRPGELHLGPRGGDVPAELWLLARRLQLGRQIRVRLVPDVRPYKNTKLMFNAAISPLAAATGLDTGTLVREPRARRIFFALLRENYAILTAAGQPLGRIGPFAPATVDAILRRPWLSAAMSVAFYPGLRGRYCSMSGDLPRGRTEVDHYTGHLLRLAGGQPCPWNRRIYEIVRRMERSGEAPGLHVLDELTDLKLHRYEL